MGKGVYSKFNVTLRIKYSNEHEYLDALKKIKKNMIQERRLRQNNWWGNRKTESILSYTANEK